MIRAKYHATHSYKPRKKPRTNWFVLRTYQIRYGFFFGFFGLVGGLVMGGLSFYLLNYNYILIEKAAIMSRPEMVENLRRELAIANLGIGIGSLGFIAFMAALGVKFSHRIVVPIFLIQEKMREICRGNLKGVSLKLRQTDEFQEFGETYNYMVETLRFQTENDFKRLNALKPDWQNRDIYHLWETLLREKYSQLNGSDDELDLSSDRTRAS